MDRPPPDGRASYPSYILFTTHSLRHHQLSPLYLSRSLSSLAFPQCYGYAWSRLTAHAPTLAYHQHMMQLPSVAFLFKDCLRHTSYGRCLRREAPQTQDAAGLSCLNYTRSSAILTYLC
jgi:hypothetical protein